MHVGEVQDEIPVVLVKVVFACLHVVSDHALVQGRLRFGHGLALKTCEPIYPFIDLAGKDRAVELSFLVRPVVEGPAWDNRMGMKILQRTAFSATIWRFLTLVA